MVTTITYGAGIYRLATRLTRAHGAALPGSISLTFPAIVDCDSKFRKAKSLVHWRPAGSIWQTILTILKTG